MVVLRRLAMVGLAVVALAAFPAAAPAPPRKPVNTALPAITGTPVQGETLSASSGTWTSTTPITYAYAWQRCNATGGGCVAIASATTASYTAAAQDVGRTLRVRVTARNDAGPATATSAATAVVQAPPPAPEPPANTSPPTISGSAQEGASLTAGAGTWSGSQPISYAYQWSACDPQGAACQDRAGETGSGYTLTAADVGATIRVTVTATNAHGQASATSAQTAVVAAAPPPNPGEVVITAAGDIAGTPTDSAGTAAVIERINPLRVLTLGDNAYPNGTAEEYAAFYDPNWGRFKAKTSPVPGNHEYNTPGAAGYFSYFGDRVPGPYYSYDLGAWHLIALNTSIPMGTGSAQLQWLQADLAANAGRCTLAYFHIPRFSSGTVHGDSAVVDPLWRALYAAGADVVLNGHEHNYERFAPQDPEGAADPSGIREFVVGTGGYFLYGFANRPAPNSEVRHGETHGVLEMTLRDGGYDWRFAPVEGATFTDTGSDTCAPTGDVTAPSVPAGLTATASSTSVALAWNASTDDTGVTGYDVHRDGVLLARATGTSYTDTAVTAGTTYSYTVRARDGAGNVSDPSAAATATVPVPTGDVSTLAPEADARVAESTPAVNAGSSTQLRVDGDAGARVESHLRFTVPSTAGTVVRATLRAFAWSDTADGPAVYGAANDWTELGVTWSTRPARITPALADLGRVGTNVWIEWDVSAHVKGPGTYTFTLAGTSPDGMDMYSREAANSRPQLVITAN